MDFLPFFPEARFKDREAAFTVLEMVLQNRFAVTAVILYGIGFMNLLLQQNLLKKVVEIGRAHV